MRAATAVICLNKICVRFGKDQTRGKNVIMIPDTLNGAIILSIIDFFLSFFIIGGSGVVMAGFPHLNRVGAVTDQDLKAGH
jgi:hypothetical protein